MEFHNTFAITMKNESAATTAYGIIKNRLELGFKTDNEYRENPSTLMASSLQVSGNTMVGLRVSVRWQRLYHLLMWLRISRNFSLIFLRDMKLNKR